MFPIPWKLIWGTHGMYSDEGPLFSIAITSSLILSLFPFQVPVLEVM